jgi:triosephosphate isomerase
MSDETVTATTAAVTRHGLTAVVCCGESLEVRESDGAVAFVQGQLRAALSDVKPNDRDRVTVAYEPIWAIGSGAAATTEDVAAMTTAIRDVLAETGFKDTPVLYGGSVNGDNTAELLDARVDGFLVGGASLRADSFLAIARAGDDWYASHGA